MSIDTVSQKKINLYPKIQAVFLKPKLSKKWDWFYLNSEYKDYIAFSEQILLEGQNKTKQDKMRVLSQCYSMCFCRSQN